MSTDAEFFMYMQLRILILASGFNNTWTFECFTSTTKQWLLFFFTFLVLLCVLSSFTVQYCNFYLCKGLKNSQDTEKTRLNWWTKQAVCWFIMSKSKVMVLSGQCESIVSTNVSSWNVSLSFNLALVS